MANWSPRWPPQTPPSTSWSALLSYEEVALGAGASLPVKAPATVGYLMWLTAAKVNTMNTRA